MPANPFSRRRSASAHPTHEETGPAPGPSGGIDGRVQANPSPPVEPIGAGPVLVLGDGQVASLAPGADHRLRRSMVDIRFVFDTTGSMSDKIRGLVRCVGELVAELSSLDLDWRMVIVPFGDLTVPGDRIETGFPLVDTCKAAQAQLRSMPRFSGGGNSGESAIEAMLAALARPWRPRAVKVVVLITDEPALVSQRARPEMVAEELRQHDAICFVASPDLPYYRAWAADNGGRWLVIGPSMDTGHLLGLLRSLVVDVATVAGQVHLLAGGSVRRYRELTSGG